MVATDLAGRGIDVVDIQHVINYDAPANREDHIHRIGRTGRFGRAGNAVTLVVEGEELGRPQQRQPQGRRNGPPSRGNNQRRFSSPKPQRRFGRG